MANIAYSFEARNADGTLATGLTPVVSYVRKELDNTLLTGVTFTFTETVPGFYKFYYDALLNGDAFLQIDLGLTMGVKRYVNMQLSAGYANLLAATVDSGITLKQALKGVIAVLFGNASYASGTIAYKDQTGTTVITGSGFDGNGTRIITKGVL